MRLNQIPGIVCAATLLLSGAACETDRPMLTTEDPAPRSVPDSPGQDHIRVRVESEPLGAIVRVNNIRRGTTPVILTLESSSDGSIDMNVAISADFSTNVRASAALGVVTASYSSGDLLPARILFLGNDVRASGRALTVK